jgi:hypothetical protein
MVNQVEHLGEYAANDNMVNRFDDLRRSRDGPEARWAGGEAAEAYSRIVIDPRPTINQATTEPPATAS